MCDLAGLASVGTCVLFGASFRVDRGEKADSFEKEYWSLKRSTGEGRRPIPLKRGTGV